MWNQASNSAASGAGSSIGGSHSNMAHTPGSFAQHARPANIVNSPSAHRRAGGVGPAQHASPSGNAAFPRPFANVAFPGTVSAPRSAAPRTVSRVPVGSGIQAQPAPALPAQAAPEASPAFPAYLAQSSSSPASTPPDAEFQASAPQAYAAPRAAAQQCQAITKSGQRCRRMTSDPSGLCTPHRRSLAGSDALYGIEEGCDQGRVL